MSSEAQLEYKIKQWGFCKNLKDDVWRYIGNVINSCSADLKKTAVILSGRRLPKETVVKQTRRTQRLMLVPSQYTVIVGVSVHASS